MIARIDRSLAPAPIALRELGLRFIESLAVLTQQQPEAIPERRRHFEIFLEGLRVDLSSGSELEKIEARLQHLEQRWLDLRGKHRGIARGALRPSMCFSLREIERLLEPETSPSTRVRGERLLYQLFELLGAAELDVRVPGVGRGETNGSSEGSATEASPRHLSTLPSRFETLQEAQDRLALDEVEVHLRLLDVDEDGDALLLALVLRPDTPPRTVAIDDEALLKDLDFLLQQSDRLQQEILECRTKLDEELRRATKVLSRHLGREILRNDLGPTLRGATSAGLERLAAVLVPRVLDPKELEGKRLTLCPPARWLGLPWLALPLDGPSKGPFGTCLVDRVCAFQAKLLGTAVARPRTDELPTKRLFGVGAEYAELWPPRHRPVSSLEPWKLHEIENTPEDSAELLAEFASARSLYLVSHLTWPKFEPEPDRVDIHPLAARLLAQGSPVLSIDQICLEACRAGEATGERMGEAFHSMALAFLRAGVREVFASAFTTFPGREENLPMRDALLTALQEGRSLAEVGVEVARARREQLRADPFVEVPAQWAGFHAVSASVASPAAQGDRQA